MNSERTYTLNLVDLPFTGHHGCREDEKKYGNEFTVTVSVTFRSDCACTDSLERTIDCSAIYACVAETMNGERVNLIETLAARISDHLEAAFPSAECASVTVTKKNPPLAGPCPESKVTTGFKRGNDA